jgi:hypothetical protein
MVPCPARASDANPTSRRVVAVGCRVCVIWRRKPYRSPRPGSANVGWASHSVANPTLVPALLADCSVFLRTDDDGRETAEPYDECPLPSRGAHCDGEIPPTRHRRLLRDIAFDHPGPAAPKSEKNRKWKRLSAVPRPRMLDCASGRGLRWRSPPVDKALVVFPTRRPMEPAS